MVRLLTSVQSKMRLQVALLVEGFLAVFERTDEVTCAIVLLQVHLEALLPTVGLIAALDWTDKIFLLLVRFSMISQMALGHKRF